MRVSIYEADKASTQVTIAGITETLSLKRPNTRCWMQGVDNSFRDYRRAVFDPEWFYYKVCSFCRAVCSSRRGERLANRERIVHLGTAEIPYFDNSCCLNS